MSPNDFPDLMLRGKFTFPVPSKYDSIEQVWQVRLMCVCVCACAHVCASGHRRACFSRERSFCFYESLKYKIRG
jgi:hypothetical protein